MRGSSPIVSSRRGLTLVELLVAIAIVAVLAAVLFPALMRARAAARTRQCASRLGELATATGMYHDQHGMFPGVNPRTAIKPPNPGYSHFYSFHTGLLPYIDQQAIHDRIDFRQSSYAPENLELFRNPIEVFLCPSDAPTNEGRTNYLVSSGTWKNADAHRGFDGVFNPKWERPITRALVRDGLENTALFSETLRGPGSDARRNIYENDDVAAVGTVGQIDRFRSACKSVELADSSISLVAKGSSWYSPNPGNTAYNHIMPPNANSCMGLYGLQTAGIAATSNHPRGVNLALLGGSVRFVSNRVDSRTWWALGSIAGGEIIGEF